MKIVNMYRLIIILLFVLCGQPINCAIDMPNAVMTDAENKQDLGKAVAETALVVKNATEAMDNARKRLFGVTNEDKKNVKIIIAQNAISALAKQKLEQLHDQLEAKGYLGQFIAGAKKIGATIAAPFKANVESERHKDLIIKGLREQLSKITDDYIKIADDYIALRENFVPAEKVQFDDRYFVRLEAGLAPEERTQLYNRYKAIVEQLDDAIYEREVTIGNVSELCDLFYFSADFEPKTDVASATTETERIVTTMTKVLDDVRNSLLSENTTKTQDRRNVIRIIESVISIERAKLALKRLREKLEKKVEDGSQESYINQLIAGFKSFVGGSDKDKEWNKYREEFDLRVVETLIEQRAKIADSYGMRTPDEQAQLKERYSSIIELINKNIVCRQNLQNLSFIQRAGLFGLGAVPGAVIGFATGARLANKYFGKTSAVEQAPEQPREKQITEEVLITTPTETLVEPSLKLPEVTPSVPSTTIIHETPVIQPKETFIEETFETKPTQVEITDLTDLEPVEKEEEIVQEEPEIENKKGNVGIADELEQESIEQERIKDTRLREIDKLDALIEREKDVIVQYTRKMRAAQLDRDKNSVDLYKDSILTIENYVKDLNQKREILWDAVMAEQRDLASLTDEGAQQEQEELQDEESENQDI